jgi:hypothetical protein
MGNVELMSYFLTSASKTKLTNAIEVHKAIRGLKVARSPGLNGIVNRALNLLPH